MRLAILMLATLLPLSAFAQQQEQDGGITTFPLDDPFADVLREDDATTSGPTEEPPVFDDTAEAALVDAPKARLRGLDTLTNTVNDFEIAVGETLRFKRLIVRLEACRYPEGDLTEEAYAFLRIRDQRETLDRFSGWMIASSPALSALDHPRYDIWVLSCITE
ncbi:DUF2155 domain-containing protein [Oceanibium sediminis]|uniref:DUF2155 domain-containing protein n=1 Tax=Oceanibium sediminis TaxID=2026339 RepID=UPI000DD46CF1|nr:DUF2155 domain-containing protein [Oceanibium sediminis]